MKVINVEEGQSIGDALAAAGAPEAVVNLVSGIMGEDSRSCDCPPGTCLGGDEFADNGDDDEFTVEFEPDFELVDELSQDQKVEAVAQLGRIVEGVTIATQIHARLIQDLVD